MRSREERGLSRGPIAGWLGAGLVMMMLMKIGTSSPVFHVLDPECFMFIDSFNPYGMAGGRNLLSPFDR